MRIVLESAHRLRHSPAVLITGSAEGLAATVSPGWAPGVAHFTGKEGEKAAEGEKAPEADAKLDALEKEIADHRADK